MIETETCAKFNLCETCWCILMGEKAVCDTGVLFRICDQYKMMRNRNSSSSDSLLLCEAYFRYTHTDVKLIL